MFGNGLDPDPCFAKGLIRIRILKRGVSGSASGKRLDMELVRKSDSYLDTGFLKFGSGSGFFLRFESRYGSTPSGSAILVPTNAEHSCGS